MDIENVFAKTEKNTAPLTATRVRHVRPWLFLLSTVIFSTLFTLYIAIGSPPPVLHKFSFAATESKPYTRLTIRREWRVLSNEQKLHYISAVQCLHRLPGISHMQGAKTRFDDFVALHVVSTDAVHNVGHFLPWHRRFLNVYETALREECGFTGALPYWNWSQDIASGRPLVESPIFDPVYGFGGNGADILDYAGSPGKLKLTADNGWVPPSGGGGCVTDGPFSEFMLNVGPGQFNTTERCLTRAINDHMQRFLTPAMVADLAPLVTFEKFRIELEGMPVTETLRVHDAGHNAVDGDMGDRYSSPGDPLFYLHHAFLDKLWWDWVGIDVSSRQEDISGRSTVDPPYVSVTLDFELDMMMLAPPVTIKDIVDTRNRRLCYIYE